ncbi:hypothetical protein [Planctomicrobium sp. SH664]|uniref:hypothetical protein n=1 Tax=Planctomicrobium sp. SH664 TaxID=3448125 RepID=UPI003F5AF762
MPRAIRLGVLLGICLVSLTTSASAGRRSRTVQQAYCPPAPVPCRASYDERDATWVCMNRPVPPGFVVVGRKHSVGCNGLGYNAWIIQKPSPFAGAEMTICSDQPVPPGWTVIGTEKSVFCPDKHNKDGNSLRIKKL